MGNSPVLWGPNSTANNLESALGFNNGANSGIITGTTDPTVVATYGVQGSLYLNSANGATYQKQDNGTTTNWLPFSAINGLVWTPYTPTLTTNTGTLPVSSTAFEYKQVGDSIDILAKISFTTTGTWSGLNFNLPNSYVIDTSKAVDYAVGNNVDSSTVTLYPDGVQAAPATLHYQSTSSYGVYILTGGLYGSYQAIDQSTPLTWTSAAYLLIKVASIPIVGLTVSSLTGSGAVTSLNSLTGALNLVAGSGVTITPSGSNITISSSVASLTFADSLVNTSGTITLKNDSGSPTAFQYYGTNGSGTLGYYTAVSTIPVFTGDTGTGGVAGLVPAPPAGSKAAGDYLAASGSWAYVDQSKPRYNPLSYVNTTPWTGSTSTKFENLTTYTGIDGYKKYAAVVAGGAAGTLFIWDISNPKIPSLCSSIILSGAYNVAVAQISGSIYAFVPSSGGSSLYIINVTNPFALTTTSSLLISNSPGSLYAISYANGYVYLATQNKGLTVVDVGGGLAGGTITTPVQSYQEGGTTNKSGGVIVVGNVVYTTNYQTTFPATIRYLKTWNLASGGGTLAVPVLANTYTVPGGPTATSTKPLGISASAAGNTLYVTDGNQGVIDIIDVTSPTSPNYLTYVTPSYALIDNSLGVAVASATISGNYLYVPSGSSAVNGGAIDLFDVSIPASPIKVNTVYNNIPNDVFGGIALSDGFVFGADYGVSGGYSGLAVFTQAELNPTFGLPVTSNIQVQQLTASTALVSNANKQLASSVTTATELSYLHGVTSNVQTQINALSGAGVSSLNSLTGALSLVAGSGITVTPSGSTITLTATGGGGLSRSVHVVSSATTAGSTAATDYVYFASGTTTITLPTAVGNSNLYTIKNVGSAIITIATTSSQTIDGSASASLAVQYTSLDLISDGSNWNIV